MSVWRTNTIAGRMTVTIILAVSLGILLEVLVGFCVAYFAAGPGAEILAAPSGAFIFDSRKEPVFSLNLGHNPEALVGKVVAVAGLIDTVPPAYLPEIVAASSRPNLELHLMDGPPLGGREEEAGDLRLLRRMIEFQLGGPSTRRVFVTRSGSGASISIELALSDGRWLQMSMPDFYAEGFSPLGIVPVTLPLYILAGLLGLLTARRLASPIRNFAAAAERLGLDPGALPLPESGPQELRVATRAFNRMQERLQRLVADRILMLAAISHDLRTPLNRLRLRVEFLADEEQQQRIFADLEAMSAMIDTALDFARGGVRHEPSTLVDLGILVEDVCEDAADAGAPVSYSGDQDVHVYCQPPVIVRALSNLIDNAVKYGERADVTLMKEEHQVVIAVMDDGPGIPEEEREKVFGAFYRLDHLRDLPAGGVGLGLNAARTLIRANGGDITLANRNEGGLIARIVLPAGD